MPAIRLIASVMVLIALTAGPSVAADGDDGPLSGAAILDAQLSSTSTSNFGDSLGDYSAWEDAVAAASQDSEPGLDQGEPEAVAVPEPSAFAMLAGLAGLLLAMTLVRWHFDKSSTAVAPQAS